MTQYRARTRDERERIAERMRARWADPAYRARVTRGRWGNKPEWHPPEEHLGMYLDLRAKVGPTEARRLLEEHIAIVRLRAENAAARARA